MLTTIILLLTVSLLILASPPEPVPPSPPPRPQPHPYTFNCENGTPPSEPNDCYLLINRILNFPWTRHRLYFSAQSGLPALIPYLPSLNNCDLSIIPVSAVSGATFALSDYLQEMYAMVDYCIERQRKEAYLHIPGIASGVNIIINGRGGNNGTGDYGGLYGPGNGTAGVTA